MSNRLEYLLDAWYPERDTCQWVLATIIKTKGSAYRKAGARMLINSLGQSFGLLSGGCLESDLMRQSRKCWAFEESRVVTYDMQEDSEIAWQLGIGCGGLVKVLLQPVGPSNHYQDLFLLREQLKQRNTCYYQQFWMKKTVNENNQVILHKSPTIDERLNTQEKYTTYTSKIKPRPSIAIVGGGMDAVPLVNIASTLGWHTSVFDVRTHHVNPHCFQQADEIIKTPYETLLRHTSFSKADAIIIMNHNVTLDAKALLAADQTRSSYIGILGPAHRTETKVLVAAGISRANLSKPLYTPVGLDLGGELPESIALSIVAQAHALIEDTCSQPLANVVST